MYSKYVQYIQSGTVETASFEATVRLGEWGYLRYLPTDTWREAVRIQLWRTPTDPMPTLEIQERYEYVSNEKISYVYYGGWQLLLVAVKDMPSLYAVDLEQRRYRSVVEIVRSTRRSIVPGDLYRLHLAPVGSDVYLDYEEGCCYLEVDGYEDIRVRWYQEHYLDEFFVKVRGGMAWYEVGTELSSEFDFGYRLEDGFRVGLPRP